MTTFNASTNAGLVSALTKAGAGDVIELEAGDYGDVILKGRHLPQLAKDGVVTVKSADPGNPAIFSTMMLRDAANVTFDGIHFDYTASAEHALTYSPFQSRDLRAHHHPQLDLHGRRLQGKQLVQCRRRQRLCPPLPDFQRFRPGEF